MMILIGNGIDAALGIYEPRIKSKADMLLSRIAQHEGTPLDTTELDMFFSFDVLGDIGKKNAPRIQNTSIPTFNRRSQASQRILTCSKLGGITRRSQPFASRLPGSGHCHPYHGCSS